ncbi:hypothetical protein AB0N06_23220 [Streptomyces sp. NPDC051020]|uniref:hypothetical protein n=1 Tax=Streptomyces sp. NPDC051020 TaxID=3155409 RepID=UPI00343EF339
MDAFKPVIDQMRAGLAPCKQRFTVMWIFDRLVDEFGADEVSCQKVRGPAYVATRRKAVRVEAGTGTDSPGLATTRARSEQQKAAS